MKFIIIVALMLVCFSANAIITQSNSGSSMQNDGSTFKYHDKVELMVKAGSVIVKGQALQYSLSADDGFTVIPAVTAGVKIACIASEAIASGAYGKCQVWGHADFVLVDADTVATAGELGYASTTAGYVKGYPKTTINANAWYAPVGYFYDSESASGAKEFFISTF